MFESKHWLKELMIIVVLQFAIGIGVGLLFPFYIAAPLAIGILFLIIWQLHKSAVKVRSEINMGDFN